MTRIKILLLSAAVTALAGCPTKPEDMPLAPVGMYTTPAGLSNSQSVQVHGRINTGETVELFLDGMCNGARVAWGDQQTFASGGVTVMVPANQSTLITARAKKGELVSPCSEPVAYVHDGNGPAAPEIATAELIWGGNPVTVRLTGTTEKGAKLSVYPAADCAGTPVEATVDTAGNWTAETTTLANAITFFAAKARDSAGNSSDCGPYKQFEHDDVAPLQPVLATITPSSPSKNSQVKVGGSAEAGSKVRAFRDAQCSLSLGGETTSGPNNFFEVTFTVPTNTTTAIHVNATDAHGNVSVCSTPFYFTHDNVAPSQPYFSSTTPTSPSNTTTSFTATVNGEPGSIIEIFPNALCSGAPNITGTMPEGGAGTVTLTVPAQGQATFTARSTDKAQNTSSCSASLTLAHDSIAPATPVLTGTTPTSPSTTNTYPTLSGTGEPGSIIEVYRSSGCSAGYYGTVTVGSSGTFSTSVTVTANKTNVLSARATDGAGNASACSNDVIYVHDNLAPARPTLAGTNPPSPAKTTTPQLVGVGEAGTTVQVFANATCSGTPDATAVVPPPPSGSTSGNGMFSVALTVPATTVTALSANLLDSVGNFSPCAYSINYEHTAGKGWGLPLTIASSGAWNAPAVAMTSTGATAMWTRTGSGQSPVLTSEYVNGAWTTPTAVGSVTTEAVDKVRLVTNPAGDAFAVWSQYQSGSTTALEAFAAARTGGTWQAPVSLGAGTSEPDVAADPNGNAMAVWRTSTQVEARQYSSTAGWGTTTRVDSTTYADYAPKVAMLSTGEAIVLFTENTYGNSSSYDYLWSNRTVGGAWQVPQKRWTYNNVRGEYHLQPGSAGTAMMTFVARPSSSSSYRPVYQQRFTGATFTTAATLSYYYQTTSSSSLAVNATDGATAIFSSGSSLSYARATAAAWSSYTTLTGATVQSGTPVKVAQDAAGNSIAVWIGTNGLAAGTTGLWMSTFTGSTWGTPQLVDASVSSNDRFDVAMDADRAVVVWYRTDSSGASVNARVLE